MTMDRPAGSTLTLDRLAAASGIVFVLLIILSVFVSGQPPALDEPVQKLAARYRQDDSQILAAAFIAGVASIFFFWFLGTLVATLRQAENDVGAATRAGIGRLAAITLAAGVADAALVFAGTAIGASLATQGAQQSNPDVIGTVARAGLMILAISSFATATWTASASLGLLRTGILARAVGLAGLVVAGLWLLSGLAVLGAATDVLAVLGFITLIAWLLWIAAVSWFLMQRTARGAGATARAR